MNEFWASMDLLGKVLFCTALASTTVLVIQILLMIIGFATGGLGDAVGVDGGDMDGDGLPDSNDGAGTVGLITVKGIVSFFAIGGWTALGLNLGGAHVALVIIIGFLAGALTLVGVGFLYRALYKLQSNGSVQLANGVGKTAEVYIPIQAHGGNVGKINVVVQERLVEADARTLGDKDLATGSFVKIVDIVGGVYVVESADENK